MRRRSADLGEANLFYVLSCGGSSVHVQYPFCVGAFFSAKLFQNTLSAIFWRSAHTEGGKVRLGEVDLPLPQLPLLVAAGRTNVPSEFVYGSFYPYCCSVKHTPTYHPYERPSIRR